MSERHNEGRFLDNRQEIARFEQTTLGMIPADQCLHADNPARGELDLWLIVEFQLVVFEGLP
jgi:hypothetical protein